LSPNHPITAATCGAAPSRLAFCMSRYQASPKNSRLVATLDGFPACLRISSILG
jgi:hypothetical protein